MTVLCDDIISVLKNSSMGADVSLLNPAGFSHDSAVIAEILSAGHGIGGVDILSLDESAEKVGFALNTPGYSGSDYFLLLSRHIPLTRPGYAKGRTSETLLFENDVLDSSVSDLIERISHFAQEVSFPSDDEQVAFLQTNGYANLLAFSRNYKCDLPLMGNLVASDLTRQENGDVNGRLTMLSYVNMGSQQEIQQNIALDPFDALQSYDPTSLTRIKNSLHTFSCEALQKDAGEIADYHLFPKAYSSMPAPDGIYSLVMVPKKH